LFLARTCQKDVNTFSNSAIFTLQNSTDVWALGCCLYSLAYLQNCFEEGSNLAILSVNYKIPEDNPYGEGLVELIDRMLTVDNKARADMTEVILCLSAIYSGRPLPPRKKNTKKKDDDVGTFRTDGQGIQEKKKKKEKKAPSAVSFLSCLVGEYYICVCVCVLSTINSRYILQGKKLASDSAAARRLRGRSMPGGDPSTASPSPGASGGESNMFDASFSAFASKNPPAVNEDYAFSTEHANFAEVQEGNFASFEAGGKQEGGKNGFGGFKTEGGSGGGGGGKADWGSEHSELRNSGTLTADGFPASFSAEGAQQAAAAQAAGNGDVTAQMEEMAISEEEASRRRRRS
jgi:serine/threonine protein kinase